MEQKWTPTRAMQRLLTEMLKPESLNMTADELAKAAGVSRSGYYRCMNDPEFRAWVTEERRQAVFRHIDPILKAAVSTAAKDGREGHQDRKMLLEMAGLYQPKGPVDGGGGGGQPLTIIIGGSVTVGGQPGDGGGAEPDG